MKSLHLGIILVVCIMLFVTWYVISYDFDSITKENIFGINALVIHHPVYPCPAVDCYSSDYSLKINSKYPTILVGYDICNGILCIKKDNLEIPLPIVDVLHPEYKEIPLSDTIFWKDGDIVDIKVKVVSLSTTMFGLNSTNYSKTWVDLGKSEIVKSS